MKKFKQSLNARQNMQKQFQDIFKKWNSNRKENDEQNIISYLMTTTIILSIPEEAIADCIGFPAVPDGSPSSLLRN